MTFTATVSPAGATGTVQFAIDNGTPVDVPVAAGQAAYTTSALAVGNHTVGAGYGGDTTYLPSTSATITQAVGSGLRATRTTLTSNRTPAANLGQTITFTAAVAPVTGTGVPTGSVQFSIDGSAAGAPVALDATGRARLSTATLAAGSHNVIAVYAGSTVFAGSASATLVQVVNQAASATTLASSVTRPSPARP